MFSTNWADKNGDLWIFSGIGWGEQYSHYGELSDMWFGKFAILSAKILLLFFFV